MWRKTGGFAGHRVEFHCILEAGDFVISARLWERQVDKREKKK